VRANLPSKEVGELVRLIDSTTIDLNLNQFKWAKFRTTKAGIKLHTVYDPTAQVPTYFEMTHAKVNDRKVLEKLPILAGVTYVVGRAYNDYGWYYALNQMGSFFVGRMKKDARYEVIETQESKSDFSFFSHDLKRSAEEITALYKQRWQIELFFIMDKTKFKNKTFFRPKRKCGNDTSARSHDCVFVAEVNLVRNARMCLVAKNSSTAEPKSHQPSIDL